MSEAVRGFSYESAIRLRSAANLREHWAVKAQRVKKEREIGYGLWPLLVYMRLNNWDKATVTLTRIAPRDLDGDNLQAAFKAIRDEVARCLNIDDADSRVEWIYRQEKPSRPKEYGVRVLVQELR